MKANYWLMGLALPLAFASCTDDALESVSSPTLAENGRRGVKEVVLSFDETRMQFNGSVYTPEAGKDKVGAMLMDVVADPATYKDAAAYKAAVDAGNWMDLFKFVNYTHTNFPFSFDGTAWKTESSVMSEGNYFFLYPMNEDGGMRNPNKVALGVDGEYIMAKGDKALDVFSKYQKFVGYSKVVADKEKDHEVLNVKMEPLLSYVGFRIHNTGNTSENDKVALHKVILSNDNGLVQEVQILPSFTGSEAEYKTFEDKSAADQRDLIVNKTVKGSPTTSKTITVKFEDCTLYGGDTKLVYVLGFPQALSNAKLTLYTDKGMAIADLTAKHDAATGSTNMTNSAAVTKFGDIAAGTPNIVEVVFDNTALYHPTELTINAEQDLIDLLTWNAKGVNEALTATLAKEITITPEVIAALGLNKSNKLTIKNQKVKVPSTEALAALADVTLSSCAVEITGNVASGELKTAVTVAKGATLTLNAEAKKAITNNGTVIIAKEQKDAATTITNNAKATVKVNANTSAVITNSGDVEVADNVKLENIENKGKVTLNGASTKYISKSTSDGIVDNNVKSPYVSVATGEKIAMKGSIKDLAAMIAMNAKEITLDDASIANTAKSNLVLGKVGVKLIFANATEVTNKEAGYEVQILGDVEFQQNLTVKAALKCMTNVVLGGNVTVTSGNVFAVGTAISAAKAKTVTGQTGSEIWVAGSKQANGAAMGTNVKCEQY